MRGPSFPNGPGGSDYGPGAVPQEIIAINYSFWKLVENANPADI